MKNIQIIDGAKNCVYDVFAATKSEFEMIFNENEDIAFIEDVFDKHRNNEAPLAEALSNLWNRRITKQNVSGIHGVLFFQMPEKKIFYPTRRDEEAKNPDGTLIR